MRIRRLTVVLSVAAASVAIMVLTSIPAVAKPFHVLVPHRYTQPPTTAQCVATQGVGIPCYSPAQFQQAYNMKPLYQAGLTGKGETIVLVDSFGSPTIQNDLATFDQQTGLPAPPSFRVIQPAGPVPAYNPSTPDMTGWAEETSLDVEYSHAMAPAANILLVETPVDETEGVQGFPQIVKAENYVINHKLGDVISQSFGATEETFPNPQAIFGLRGAYRNAAAHGVTVLGSSGDDGASGEESDLMDFYPFRVNSWPSTDPLVTSVGGTQLHLDQNGLRTAPDNVWNDTALLGGPAASGGGVSAVFRRPFYQDAVAPVMGSARGTPDVAMSAAVDGAALVYMSFAGLPSAPVPSGPGWYLIGGTSEASPLFSGLVAIADQAAGHRLGLLNPALYALGDGSGSGIVDITRGNNTVTFTQTDPNAPDYNQTYTVRGYRAVHGYDLASGLGTANGARLVSQLAASGRP